LGVARIFQETPFHTSANVPPPDDPAAVHAVADVQDTAYKVLEVAPTGLGVFWSFQAVQFQCSANVDPPEAPTPMQSVAEPHEIPSRLLLTAPAGSGVFWIRHGVRADAMPSGTFAAAATVLPASPNVSTTDATAMTATDVAAAAARDFPPNERIMLLTPVPDRGDP